MVSPARLVPALLATAIAAGAGELSTKHRLWLEREVGLIITSAEREVFTSLDSDALRDDFIEEFWRVRDETPGTARNEFREEFEERIRAADRLYGYRDRPGWRSERGRIYVLLGPPHDLHRLPASRTFYPLEIWSYNEVVSAGIHHPLSLLFFKRAGIGDYALYSPNLDGVQALLTPTQAHRTVVMPNDAPTREMLLSQLQLSISETPVVDAAIYVAPRVTGAGAEAVLARVQSPPAVPLVYLDRYFEGAVASDAFFRAVPFRAATYLFRNPEGGSVAELAVELPADALPFEENDGAYQLRLMVGGELRNRDDAAVDRFDGRIDVELDSGELASHRHLPLLYRQRLLLFPGDYTLDLTLRTPATRAMGHRTLRVVVPREPERLDASDLVLTRSPDEGADSPEATPFQRHGRLVLPAIDGRIRRGTDAFVYYELYSPEPRRASGDIEIETLLLRGDDVLARVSEELPVSDGTIPIHRALPIEGLDPGRYALVIQATDAARGETVVRETELELTDDFLVRGRIDAVVRRGLEPANVSTKLGVYWLGQGDVERARRHFEAAYRREPRSAKTRVHLSRVLALQGELPIARDLLAAVLREDAGNVEAWLAMAFVRFRLDEPGLAVESYEKALELEPSTLAWNGLAELQLALGNRTRAIDCLKQSLEIDPEQPGVSRRLEELETRPAR